MTLREDIENTVKTWGAALDRKGEGGDWYQLTPAEAEVFAIESHRWPRMLTAWEFYEHLIDIVDDDRHDAGLIAAERRHWPGLRPQVTDLGVFMEFAEGLVGLTKKEAHAVFYKIELWKVRNGLMFGDSGV